MENKHSHYIPALRFHWLTPFYDSLLKWGMREEFVKSRLIERAHIQPRQRVLDLGCGTGTLVIMIKQSSPEAHVTGLDGDEEVLSIARTKAKQANINIQLDHGLAYELPYPDDSFDVVVSSFVIHHLTSEDKLRAFKEVRRVLRADGWFHILDFGRPVDFLTRTQALVFRMFEQTADNFNGRIPFMLKEAGFDSVAEAKRVTNIFGPIWFYEAHKQKEGSL
ncbi:MAG: methyltransferase domain-containing protein [Chloroflexi bacterium]|nr:methyltransferase domain-containing protein [Chloroflexota bacterium]